MSKLVWKIMVVVLFVGYITAFNYGGCGGGGSDNKTGDSEPTFPGYSGNLTLTGGVIYDGGNMDCGADIAVDNTITTSPVVYVLGAAFTSTTSSGGDAVISKFNSNGDIIAAVRFNGTGGMALAVNQNGVYMTGQRPTPNAYVTAKYDLDLNLITSNALAGDASARAIALDNSGNVYVIGSETHTPAETGNEFDYKIVKYDANLVQQGSPVIYDSGAKDEGSGIAIDNAGNIFVTGMKISGTGYSIVTLKYNSLLALQNTAEYSVNVYYNSNHGLYPKIAVDKNSGSVYVAGTIIGAAGPGDPFRDILLIKYDSSLNQVGTAIYTDGLEGTNLTVDASGNVYVNGNYYDGVVQDAWLVVKYNSALDFQSYFTDKLSSDSMDEPGGIALDSAGNVYLSGITAPTYIQGDMSNFNLRAKRFPPMITTPTAGVVTGTVTYTGSLGPVSASKPIIVVMNPFPDVFDGFVANGTTYQTVTLTASGTFTFTNVPPGQYHLAVLLDVNNDGATTGDPCEIYTPGSDVGSNRHNDEDSPYPATPFTITAGQLYTTSPNISFNDTMRVGQ